MDIADILFHVPADLSATDRANIERDIQGCDGVISVHFSRADAHMLGGRLRSVGGRFRDAAQACG